MRIRIRIQFQGLDDQKLGKNVQLEFFFLSKIAIYLSLSLHIGRSSYRRSLKREHPALQKMKFLHFFLLLWVIFVLPDPDSKHL
jgi:hypothetical protein